MLTEFNPEIFAYLEANGYSLVNNDSYTQTITYRKDSKAVILWGDRIEVRTLEGNKQKAWMLSKSYRGFDGKNLTVFMLLMHIMGAASIKNMADAAQENVEIPFTLIHSLPQSALA